MNVSLLPLLPHSMPPSATRDLPVLPTVLSKLLALSPNQSGYFDRVAKIAALDPPLSIKLLRAVNSGASSPRTPVVDIASAVARLGPSETAGIVTGLTVTRVFFPRTDSQKDLWRHAVAVAVIARDLARAHPSLQRCHEAAYAAGLVHDIGRFMLFQDDVDGLERTAHLWKTHEDIALNERQLFQIDHCQLGAAAWPLPTPLRDVIRLHHDYGPIRTDYELLVRTIQVADLAEVRVLRGGAWRDIPEAKRPHWVGQQAGHASWPGLPFDAKAFAARLPELSHQVAEAVDALGLGG